VQKQPPPGFFCSPRFPNCSTRHQVQIHNSSEVDFELERNGEAAELHSPRSVILPAGKTVLLQVEGKDAPLEGIQSIDLPYHVKNLLVGPNQPLEATIPIRVNFVRSDRRDK
jgi:hypothetical protein